MVEKKSLWVLQEIFVDPGIVGKNLDCDLNLKVMGDVRKEKNIFKITTEIFGSITTKDEQIANLRFVNITELETNKNHSTKTIFRKVSKKKVEEFVSFLPLYLIKAGITAKGIEYEL
ncbi:MAG: hypothetical protein ABGX27_01395 [Desulfurobacteriaceae bacterium]